MILEIVKVTPKRSTKTIDVKVRPNTTDNKVIKEVLLDCVYEKPKIGFFIEPNDAWLDLGANIGTFALLCYCRGADVVCYEPEMDNFYIIKDNLKGTNYPVFDHAVDVTSGYKPLYLCNGDYNKYRHTLRPIRGRNYLYKTTTSLEDILKKHPQINAIKMDIEGTEIPILESFDFTQTQIKKLVFEYSFDADRSIPRFLNIIAKLREHFPIVHFTKVKEDDQRLTYDYYPPQTMVYCLGEF